MSISAAIMIVALGVFVQFHSVKSMQNNLINRMNILGDDIVEHELYTLESEDLKFFFMSNKSYHKESYQEYLQEINFYYVLHLQKEYPLLSVIRELPNKKYLVIISSSKNIDKQAKELLLKLILILLSVFALIILGLYLLLKKLLQPLECLVQYCNTPSIQRISSLECNGSNELHSLKEAIIGLETKNQTLCKEKQNIFKEAAHEIKTPLAILKARVALFEKDGIKKPEFIKTSLEDIATISNKLRELIFLKAIEWDIQQAKEIVQMQEQCSMMQQLFRPILIKKDLEMISNLQDDFALYIHKEAIGRVMQAIFENIFIHTKRGTRIYTYVDSSKYQLNIVNEIGQENNEMLFSSHIGSKLIARLADKLDYEYTLEARGHFFYTTITFKGQEIK